MQVDHCVITKSYGVDNRPRRCKKITCPIHLHQLLLCQNELTVTFSSPIQSHTTDKKNNSLLILRTITFSFEWGKIEFEKKKRKKEVNSSHLQSFGCYTLAEPILMHSIFCFWQFLLHRS